MQTSPKGIALIAAHEGVVTKAYRDVGGTWTIGVGHTAAAGPPRPLRGMTITRAAAFDILHRDLSRHERRVDKAMPDLPQHVFDGAVSFDFNTGAINRASWVKAFRIGDTARARQGLMKWTKAGGRTIAGLARRREAEARLIFSGEYGPASNGVAPSVAAARAPAEVREVQTALAALGFYDGPVDGIAGPKTKAAVLSYQRSHPDLVADGMAGAATRASLARDTAARNRVRQTGLGAIVSAILAAFVSAAAGGTHLVLIAAAIGLTVLVLAGGALARAYRGELARVLKPRKG